MRVTAAMLVPVARALPPRCRVRGARDEDEGCEQGGEQRAG